jgi:L-amino acid N-acyltransferase
LLQLVDVNRGKMMRIVQCELERHGEQILAILNAAILQSTALYDYKPRTPEMMTEWFDTKIKGNFPVIGIENESSDLMGFGSYGTFRAWPAYKYSVEHSVYVDVRFRGQGLGKRLLQELITTAQAQNYHILVAGIDATNPVGIHLHESLGFVHCGTIQQAGFKFGRWLDLSFYQLVLPTPVNPADG